MMPPGQPHTLACDTFRVPSAVMELANVEVSSPALTSADTMLLIACAYADSDICKESNSGGGPTMKPNVAAAVDAACVTLLETAGGLVAHPSPLAADH